ncbi:MAG: alcohol dehydrogenase catalytic domain-containing protein [Oscillospiraceae bacterium]|nr:alcohol dehydrogenase catalytic domain-containing protein [Oscillospiraceae bacterium]
MINVLYRLTAPGMIELACEEQAMPVDQVLLRPVLLSICKADQRYYQGQRSPEVLKAKLPMALIHECCAEVVNDPRGELPAGTLVVPVPNLPTQIDPYIAENYLPASKFRSSGFDGYLQEYVYAPRDHLVCAPRNTLPEVSAFLELISVSAHAISRFERIAHQRRERLAVWGDGNVGYITALLLRAFYPNAELIVLGTVFEKLSLFSFADRRMHVDDVRTKNLCDHAFECVGGAGARAAINQMIDVIAPEGALSLLGVSENFVDINTRMVLEKGLRLFGSSRSGTADFARAAEILERDPHVGQALERLVAQVVRVRSIADIHKAFALDAQQNFGKTVLEWQI